MLTFPKERWSNIHPVLSWSHPSCAPEASLLSAALIFIRPDWAARSILTCTWLFLKTYAQREVKGRLVGQYDGDGWTQFIRTPSAQPRGLFSTPPSSKERRGEQPVVPESTGLFKELLSYECAESAGDTNGSSVTAAAKLRHKTCFTKFPIVG